MSKVYVQEWKNEEYPLELERLYSTIIVDEEVNKDLSNAKLICSIQLKGSGQGDEQFFALDGKVYYRLDCYISRAEITEEELIAKLDAIFKRKTVAKLKGETELEEDNSFALLEGDYSHLHGTTVEFLFRATEEEWANRSEQHKALYGDDEDLFTVLTEDEAKAELEKGAVYIEMTVLE
jgi:hypothetical protein